MSKYTEAEAKIKKIMCEEIDRLPSHFDGEDEVYDSIKDVDEILKLNKTICKALDIADRLEYAYHNAFGIDLAKCTKYGNESAEQQRDSYSTVMMYEVANVFDDILGE